MALCNTPPSFNKDTDNYSKWKKKLDIWLNITDIAKVKRGGLIILRLDDETQEKVLENIASEEISSEEGAKKVVDQLDTIFKEDASLTAFECYEAFETYSRPHSASIKDYLDEFQKRLKKVQTKSGTTLGDAVLAYRLLRSANLSESDTKLVRATTDEMTYRDLRLKTP